MRFVAIGRGGGASWSGAHEPVASVDDVEGPIGKPHSDVSCFSFHPRKVVSMGDGGMLTTQNPEWDAQFRLLRQHAMSVPTTVRYGSTQVIFESYPTIGFNYRMTDIQAAVGREQLRRLPAIVRERRALATRYAELLAGIQSSRTGRAPPGRATACGYRPTSSKWR